MTVWMRERVVDCVFEMERVDDRVIKRDRVDDFLPCNILQSKLSKMTKTTRQYTYLFILILYCCVSFYFPYLADCSSSLMAQYILVVILQTERVL